MVSTLLLTVLLFLVESMASPLFGLSDTEANSNSAKYFRLTAKKLRGRTIDDAVPVSEAKHVLVERSGGAGYLSLDLVNENTFYLADIEIGSTSQRVGVLVDTGSSDLWVVASNNTYCISGTTGPLSSKARDLSDIVDWNSLSSSSSSSNNDSSPVSDNFQLKSVSSSSSEAIDCSVYGTFNPADSDTFTSNYTSFSIRYADNTFATGTWGHDNIIIGGDTVQSLSFAVCDNADNAMGILGIGLPGLETTYSGGSGSISASSQYQYENLPVKLNNLGIIERTAYSVYLNDTNASSANILFGAIDHSKYSGNLVALPILNTLQSMGYRSAIQLEVTLNSVTIANDNTNKQATLGNGASAALLDTGTTLTYIPSNILSNILSVIGAEYSSTLGYYTVTCDAVSDYSLIFNFQGLNIDIALSEFLVSLTSTSGVVSKRCMVGILSSQTSKFTLGDNFLRNVYMVADYEGMEIGLAVAQHDTTASEDIEVLSTGIPNAVTAASSLLWGSNLGTTLTAASSSVSLSTIPTSQNSFTVQAAGTLQVSTTGASTSRTGTRATTTRATSTSSSTNSVSSVSSISSTSRNNGNLIEANNLALLGGLFALFSALL